MVEYTDPKNRINENMSVDYNINTIPTLIIDKPTDENISLNFPSIDYVEKPSNNFSLTIDNIVADTDGFSDDNPTVNEVYVDTGVYGTKNYDWIISSKGDMIVDNEDTTFITDDGEEAFFYPNYEINYDDGIYIEFDYIHSTNTQSNKYIMFFDDYNSQEVTDKQIWTFNALGFTRSGKVKITIINGVISFYLDGVKTRNSVDFELDDDYRFGFFIDDTEDKEITITYKNFVMYSLGKILEVDESVEWTNEIIEETAFITKDEKDITIDGTNYDSETDLDFYPLINNTQFYLYDNNEIIFSFISREQFDGNQKIILKDQNDKSVEYSFLDILPNNLLQGKLSIIILDGYIKILLNENQVLLNEKIKLSNLYSMGFLLGKSYTEEETIVTPTIDMDIMNFTIQFPYAKWEDVGANLKYNTNTLENEVTTDITRDITGTTFKAKTSTGKGFVIPTMNGVYETPYVLKGSSDFEIDYYYTPDNNGNNSIFVSNRIGSQSHQIFLKDLGITEDSRIKVVTTNEFETVGSQDSNANVKVYLAPFGSDDFDDDPVYDKDISISIVRAGYYYGLRQMYRTPEFKFKNLKIKTYSYDYGISVICRGYDNMGIKEIWSDRVECTINTHNRKLLAKFSNVKPEVKYLDFVLLFDDARLTKLEINKIMLSDGLENTTYTEDTSKSALSDIWINFDRNYFCNYYNSSSSDPTGLSIIRPTYEAITLKNLPAPEKTDKDGKKGVTVLYPYLKNAKDHDHPDKVALEYLNSPYQTIKLIYNG